MNNFSAWIVHSPGHAIVLGYLLMSLITLALYGWDKYQARGQRWRIPERRLHLFELCGGWPGAWLAQRWLRHKNRKRSYQNRFRAIVALHLLLWAGWYGWPLWQR